MLVSSSSQPQNRNAFGNIQLKVIKIVLNEIEQ